VLNLFGLARSEQSQGKGVGKGAGDSPGLLCSGGDGDSKGEMMGG
jgi:hypothetical protein